MLATWCGPLNDSKCEFYSSVVYLYGSHTCMYIDLYPPQRHVIHSIDNENMSLIGQIISGYYLLYVCSESSMLIR